MSLHARVSMRRPVPQRHTRDEAPLFWQAGSRGSRGVVGSPPAWEEAARVAKGDGREAGGDSLVARRVGVYAVGHEGVGRVRLGQEVEAAAVEEIRVSATDEFGDEVGEDGSDRGERESERVRFGLLELAVRGPARTDEQDGRGRRRVSDREDESEDRCGEGPLVERRLVKDVNADLEADGIRVESGDVSRDEGVEMARAWVDTALRLQCHFNV